jgi:hypothetical protein
MAEGAAELDYNFYLEKIVQFRNEETAFMCYIVRLKSCKRGHYKKLRASYLADRMSVTTPTFVDRLTNHISNHTALNTFFPGS